MDYITGLLTFLALAGAGTVALLVWRQRQQDAIDNEWVTVVSPNLIELQCFQMETGTADLPSWNGYRNELCLYRMRARRRDAEIYMSRKRFSTMRIEH
jgi:hypothetical protein